jgi:hypothetical protein
MLTVSEDLNPAEAGTTSTTATSPVRPDIRRSSSPILDFGSRRNFCNISECSYCRPLAENHRPSPLRSPVAPPSASTKSFAFLVLRCVRHFSCCCRLFFPVCDSVCSVIVCGGSDRSQHRPRRWPASPTTAAATCASSHSHRLAQGKKKREQSDKLIISNYFILLL